MASFSCVSTLLLALMASGTMAVYWYGTPSRSPPFNYECYPDGLIVVDNTDVNGFQTAFANDTSGICTTTYSSDFTTLTIQGCSMDDDVLLVFTNRTEDSDLIIGGYGVDAYILQCRDIPDMGVTKSVIQGFSPTLSAAQVTSITPTLFLNSDIRERQWFASESIRSGVLTTTLYWTIDIPIQYFGMPSFCYVVSGLDPFDSTALRKDLIVDGCSQDLDLVGNFDNFITKSPELRRYYATFHVFKFYDSDYITLHCVVDFCQNESDCKPDCGAGRKRREASPSVGEIKRQAATTSFRILDKNLSLDSGAQSLGMAMLFLLPTIYTML